MRSHTFRRKSGRAGSLLLDLLIVSGVAAMALVATSASVLSAQRETQRSTQLRAATPLLASLLEEVRGAPYSTLATNYDGVTRPVTGMPNAVTGVTATFKVEDVPTGSPRWPVSKVTVRIQWVGTGGACSISGVTYASDRASGTSGVGGGS
jgi:hypothetical protein